MRLTIDEQAAEEAGECVAWYAARNPAAGKRLADSFVATIEQIARRPESTLC
jgi:plasmid stabilization system protein ParE